MSQAQAIRRGPAPRKRAPARRRPTKKAKQPSFSAQMAEILPFEEHSIRRATRWAMLAVVAVAAIGAAIVLRVPQIVGWEVGEGIGKLGFAVERVEIHGIDHMERLPVYAVALDQPSMAMPNVDLSEIRARVEDFAWVREARITRRLPDTLVIAITERTPSAVWQHNQRLYLVDAEGEVLEEVPLDAMPDLPLIVGPRANRQVSAFRALIDAAPALRPMLAGATWVGNRRWDLRFQTGETLALPEGEEEASRALVQFARMDGVTGLLGEGFRRFDMRVPGQFVVRVPRDRDTGAEPPVADEGAGTADT